jgi:hypothetical protein
MLGEKELKQVETKKRKHVKKVDRNAASQNIS